MLSNDNISINIDDKITCKNKYNGRNYKNILCVGVLQNKNQQYNL